KILTAVCRQRRAGDQPRFIGSEEDDTARNLLGFAQTSDRDLRQNRFLQHVLRHRLHHLGVDVARRDGIDGDAGARALLRQRLGEADLAGLGGRVIGLAELALLAVDRRDVDYAAELAL